MLVCGRPPLVAGTVRRCRTDRCNPPRIGQACGGRPWMWLQSLLAELPITLADPTVWLSIGEGLLIGAIALLFGVGVARFVGLLDRDAPAGEILGVGLASGLLVLTSWWAAIGSGGRSSFTPVAIGFALAIGLAAVRRWRRAPDGEPDAPGTL